MQVNLFAQSGSQPGDNTSVYSRIFSGPNFKLNLVKIETPDQDWIHHLSSRISTVKATELYNHYLIWLRVLQSSRSEVILYANTYPNEPDWILRQLVSSTNDMGDLILYGKQLDLCYKYTEFSTVALKSPISNKEITWPVYRTVSPYGDYAYCVTPSGAEKLIHMAITNPNSVDEMINQLAENRENVVLTFNPSIIVPASGPNHECRITNSVFKQNSWIPLIICLILIVLIGIILGAMFFFVSSSLKYRPGKEIPIVYSGPDIVLNSGSGDNIYYRSTRSPPS